MKRPKKKDFELVWRDGKREVVSGYGIQDAMMRAGIGNGAILALDYWREITDSKDPCTIEGVSILEDALNGRR